LAKSEAATHPITAVYSGDSNFKGSTSAALSQVVDKAETETKLSSSKNPSVFGQAITLTATVDSDNGPPPNGDVVTFMSGTTQLTQMLLYDGRVSYTISTLPVGTASITAVFAGDSNYATSKSTAVSQVVDKAATTTALASSLNLSKFGQSVTLTATVTAQFGGKPTGTVTFSDGTTTLGTISMSNGEAVLATMALPAGTDSITAVYGGNTNLAGSTSKAVNQVVGTATTATAIASSPNPSAFGQSVTFTATVKGQYGGSPTGAVTFKDGTTTLGTASVSNGEAEFATTALPVGTGLVTAVYGGDSNLAGGASKAVSQVVDKAATTTTLSSSKNPSAAEQSVTFTVTVKGQYGGTPTGSVTFKDGTTALTTISLSKGTVTFTPSALSAGKHSITAAYNGSADFTVSSASLTQTVN